MGGTKPFQSYIVPKYVPMFPHVYFQKLYRIWRDPWHRHMSSSASLLWQDVYTYGIPGFLLPTGKWDHCARGWDLAVCREFITQTCAEPVWDRSTSLYCPKCYVACREQWLYEWCLPCCYPDGGHKQPTICILHNNSAVTLLVAEFPFFRVIDVRVWFHESKQDRVCSVPQNNSWHRHAVQYRTI